MVINFFTEKKKIARSDVGTHPPETLLEANQVPEVAVNVTWKVIKIRVDQTQFKSAGTFCSSNSKFSLDPILKRNFRVD